MNRPRLIREAVTVAVLDTGVQLNHDTWASGRGIIAICGKLGLVATCEFQVTRS